MISTFSHSEFSDLGILAQLKKSHNKIVSVVIPALNEASTIGKIISCIKCVCIDKFNIVDEIIVIDGNSEDETVAIAKDAGAITYRLNEIRPEINCSGKGVALWKSQFVSNGDIILFIDSDIVDFDERFIYGLLGPLLHNPELILVKAYYRRPLVIENNIFRDQGGRVTELLVRPLLLHCVSDLATVFQPLSGEYAIRKDFLETISLWSGYGIEIGILLDVYFTYGLQCISQVDMEQRFHRNRPMHELNKMAGCILQVFLEKMHRQKILILSEELNDNIGILKENSTGKDAFDIELQSYSNFKIREVIHGNI